MTYLVDRSTRVPIAVRFPSPVISRVLCRHGPVVPGQPGGVQVVEQERAAMVLWCGIDWAEHHHDVALVDHFRMVVAKERISDDATGFTRRPFWAGL